MEFVALAVGFASLAAWDFGRRWVARDADAVEIAKDARSLATLASTQSKANGETLSKHASELTKLDKRQSDTASHVRIDRENRREAAVRAPGRLTGRS
jgi:hypothetical protein